MGHIADGLLAWTTLFALAMLLFVSVLLRDFSKRSIGPEFGPRLKLVFILFGLTVVTVSTSVLSTILSFGWNFADVAGLTMGTISLAYLFIEKYILTVID